MPTVVAPGGVEIAYEVTGTGRPLVLLHGITECRQAWDPLVPDLAADHTVVAVDLRGHGASGAASAYDPASMAGDVAAVVDELGLPPPVVVGHSMGGIVASAYAGAHPCAGVVNVDQSIQLGELQGLVQGAEELLRGDAFDEVISTLFGSMQGPLPDDDVARLDALRRPEQSVVLGVWAPLLELSLPELEAMVADLAAAVRVPYLALHGTDPGPGYGPWLTSVVPTATVEVWDDHGHYPHLVDRPRFVERVRRFEAVLDG